MIQHTEVVVLGILQEGPQHGYEIARRLQLMHIRSWARIGKATVYNVLGRLEKSGAVTSRVESGGKRPDRRVFTITAHGRARARSGIEDLLAARTPVYSDRVVGLAFTSLLPPKRAVAKLDAARAALDEVVDYLQRTRLEPEAQDPYGQIILAFYTKVLAAESQAMAAARDLVANGAPQARSSSPR